MLRSDRTQRTEAEGAETVMEVKRTCENCRFCQIVRKVNGITWMECRQFRIEVVEDDYCSFGDDIPEDDPWDDRKVVHNETD